MDSTIAETLALARAIREAATPSTPFTPTIIWEPAAGDTVLHLVTRLTGNIAADLGSVFQQLRETYGDPVWFAIHLDAYARETPDPAPPEGRPAVGTLESAFKLGDMSIVEQLVTIHIDPAERELTMIRQVYRYTPVDGWEWNSPQRMEAEGDAVCTAVRLFR